MNRSSKLPLATASALLLASTAAVAGFAAPGVKNGPSVEAHAAKAPHAPAGKKQESDVTPAFRAIDRNTDWKLTKQIRLNFNTFHTEGIAFTKDRIFLSAVEILEPTKKFPAPQNGYDRTPGKGVGHLFVMDRTGKLLKDIHLGEGDIYHPGGIDTDGENVWVPLAEYRPNSASIIYRVDAKTLDVHEQFRTKDHFGGIVHDLTTNRLVGNTWGSRRFAEWTMDGKQKRTWPNESHFIDYQDCQYVASRKALCGGITNLPQTPAAGGAGATYELGGMALIDLKTTNVIHEVPFQKFSPAGHVMTRNPLKLSANGTHLTLNVAPDNGEEVAGTVIYTYEADVPAGTVKG